MNERQLPGLPLHFQSGSSQGSAEWRAGALLGMQRCDLHSGSGWTGNTQRRQRTDGDAANAGRTSAPHAARTKRVGFIATGHPVAPGGTGGANSATDTGRATTASTATR